jgi:uracil-DNA glycosylase family 4
MADELRDLVGLTTRYLAQQGELGERELYLTEGNRPRRGVEHQVGAERRLTRLGGRVRSCTRCGLSRTRTQVVFGAGSAEAKLVFVGEAPGRDEDLAGAPFVGAAGRLLTKIIESIGFRRDMVYITNILKCRPPENRNPLPEEIACCCPHLDMQLDIISPLVICTLGTFASQTLLGTTLPISSLRGRVWDCRGTMLVPTYHPAALLRNPGWKRRVWEDVQLLRRVYDDLVAGRIPRGALKAPLTPE